MWRVDAGKVAIVIVLLIAMNGCSVYRVHPVLEYETTQDWPLYFKKYVKPVDLVNDDDIKFLYETAQRKVPTALTTKAERKSKTNSTTTPTTSAQTPASARTPSTTPAPATHIPTEQEAQAARDDLQSRIMRVSDAICEQHKGDIVATSSNTSLILSILTSGLAGAAGVVTTTLTKSALAAGAAFTNAANADINQEVYHKLFVATIVRAIDKSRTQEEAQIAQKRTLPTTRYNADDAIRDAQDYHQRCSFYAGLVALSEAIEKSPLTDAQIQAKVSDINNQITSIDADIKKTTQKPGDAVYEQLQASKLGLLQERDSWNRQRLRSTTATGMLSQPPSAPTAGSDASETLKKFADSIAQASFGLGHDGLKAAVAKTEVTAGRKVRIEITIATEKGSPASAEQMKTIKDDDDLKDPLLRLGNGAKLGLSRDDLEVNKAPSK